ncbi:MAG TPA: MerR family transcriptional regulator [Steroidobacteraceae bacterium]|jgi:DNA-binding transcriptional MerR regulator|nr:MerR family transcriptional regulator [Steroidobacteraceae bacterium]
MGYCAMPLSASEAATRLGVSMKALRLYEKRGLVNPGRTAAGYRAYGADTLARAAEVVALRALGLSLAQVAQVVEGRPQNREPVLAAQESALEGQICRLTGSIHRIRAMRANRELARWQNPCAALSAAFELPWPWGGEWFELREIRPINYIVGPLGSGKTRFAARLAAAIPNAAFLGLERSKDWGATAARLHSDAALKSRVDQSLASLIDEGAQDSEALRALLIALEADDPPGLVVDMIEQGLDRATQEALIIHLRQRARAGARPLFLMTRSSAILDLSATGPDEAIIFCPANHSPPIHVAPYLGAAGYEAVATCLASPEVRARTAGTIAIRRPDSTR